MGIPALVGTKGLAEGQLVEVSGPEGSGKTEVAYHVLAQCILPREWQGRQIGGYGASVFWIDPDKKFSVLRLVMILEHRLRQVLAAPAAAAATATAASARPRPPAPRPPPSSSSSSSLSSASSLSSLPQRPQTHASAEAYLFRQAQALAHSRTRNVISRAQQQQQQQEQHDSRQSLQSRPPTAAASEQQRPSKHQKQEVPTPSSIPAQHHHQRDLADRAVLRPAAQASEYNDHVHEDLVRQCLRKVVVLSPGSSLELLASVRALRVLMDTHKARLVVIDSVSAFSWSDKSSAGILPQEVTANLAAVAATLKQLQAEVPFSVLATKLLPSRDTKKEFLGRDWSQRVNTRLQVDFAGTSKPGPGPAATGAKASTNIFLSRGTAVFRATVTDAGMAFSD
jgi:RecA/RadA recombinase